MSGHSKWHNIQGKKGKADAKRGKIFTKIGKELIMAAKSGGSSPDINAKLRDVIAKAKSNNMPQDTITRAIKKGAGEMDGANYEEIIYEGYALGGVAVIVNVLTDNKNRSAANVRHAFTKYGGNMGSAGCVSFMFQSKGEMVIEKTDNLDEDELMMLALDAGAEDFATEEEVYIVTTTPEDFGSVREALESNEIEFLEADLKMIPNLYTAVDMDTAVKIQKMLDALEEDDDVQDVFHNSEFPEEFEE